MKRVEYFLYFAWMVSVIATVGSLFFSEILHFTPCVLCWYQRIFMYPLSFILAVGIVKKDKTMPLYVLPLAISGGIIAFYHLLVYYTIIPHQIVPCTLGVSCTTRYIDYLGFITIPFLSFTAFSSIVSAMIFYKKGEYR